MNKYEKILNSTGKILGFGLFALMSLGLTLLPIIVVIFVGSDIILEMLLLFEICFMCSIHIFSYALGLFFLGDHYKPTGYVSRGRSLNWPEETFIYVKRNMITNFIEIVVCSMFAVSFIVLSCLKLSLTLSICGLVLSIVSLVIFFLFYKKQQHKLKNNDLE